ncbi:MAG: helix-turn-helix domain-containing protein [Phycisphaerae bacterium]
MGISERLSYARNRMGLTLSQVSEITRLGESSLSEFENAKRQPSLSQLRKLAEAYQRSTSFFLEEGDIPPETVLWRECPDEEQRQIEARFLRLCEQYHNLEVWTEQKRDADLPFAHSKAREFNYPAAEALADKVRRELGLGDHPALSLLSVLEEDCAVKIFHLPLRPTGTAASTLSETFGAAILLNSNNVRWRRNFDLAHELFHLLTWKVFRTPSDDSDTSSSADEQEEKWATCFASNLLMPVDAVRKAVASKTRQSKLSLDSVFDMAREFDVSTEAMLWRLHHTRSIVPDNDNTKRLIGTVQKMAPAFEERQDTEPSKWPERYEKLALRALRHGRISIGRFAEYLDISRQKALKYVEQEVMDDEEVPLAPA